MTRPQICAALALASALLFFVSPVFARGYRTSQYPNGASLSCGGCHIFPGGPRNEFGLQVEETLRNGDVDWALIFDLDADGDGFTNGEELGDPLGQWRQGDPNPLLRGDPNSPFTANPPAGAAPVGQALSLMTLEDGAVNGALRASDPENNPLSYYVVEQGRLGVARVTNWNTGALRYTPNANANGVDQVRFVAWDGRNFSAPALVTVTITPQNDPPTLLPPGRHLLAEGEPFELTLEAEDIDGDALRFEAQGLPAGAALQGDTILWTPGFDQAGSYTAQVAVIDAAGARREATLTLDVSNVPQAPQILGLEAPARALEGALVTLEADAVDADGDALTFAWSLGDGSPARSGEGLRVLEGASWGDEGRYTVTLTVSDGALTATASRVVEVENVPPQISAGEALVLDEGEEAVLRGSLVDPGADVHVIVWDFGDGGEGAEGTLSPARAWGDDGVYEVTLRVSDGAAQVSAATTVTVRNVAPRVELGGERAVPAGETLRVRAAVTDPGAAEALEYAWDVDGDGEADQVGEDLEEIEVVYDEVGSFRLGLVVTDKDGGQGADEVLVRVIEGPPVVTLEALDAEIDEGGQARLRGSARDPEGLPVSLRWDFGDGVRDEVQALERGHVWRQDGLYVVTLTATDADGISASATAQVRVRNVAPVVTLGPDVVTRESSAVRLVAQVVDPGQDALRYRWDFGDGAVEVGGPEATHAWVDDGQYVVTLTVSDGAESRAAALAVEVQNVAPEITSVRLPGGAEGEVLQFEAQAVDPGQDTLTWSWDFGDGGELVRGVNLRRPAHRYRDDPPGDQVAWTVRVTVRDDDGGEDSFEGPVMVRNVGPMVALQREVFGVEGAPLRFEATLTDPGADTHEWCWDFGDGGEPSCGALSSISHTYADDGSYLVTLSVTDDDGEEFRVASLAQVSAAAPTARWVGDDVVTEGESLGLEAVVVALEGESLSYRWDFGDRSAPIQGPEAASVTHAWADDGDYTVTLEVTDDDGATARFAREVRVLNAPPQITSSPPTVAREPERYAYEAQAEDPGRDTLTWALDQGPPGMRILTNGIVLWEPAGYEGRFPVQISVRDEDGGRSVQSWMIALSFVDEDQDGAPDSCERRVGLDPTDPGDGGLDPDQDGISSAEECLSGSDPLQSGAPTAPSVDSPAEGAIVPSLGLVLSVNNAEDADGDALRYTFEVASSAGLDARVLLQEGVAEGSSRTRLDLREVALEAPLEEDQRYWWRARACDAAACGPWTEVASFLLSDQNDAPSAPTARGPAGEVVEGPVWLEADASVDPEGERLEYDFQVSVVGEAQALFAGAEGIEADDEGVRWELTRALEEGVVYAWRVRARDPGGRVSPWSASPRFGRGLPVAVPEAPALVSPVEGARLSSPSAFVFVAQAPAEAAEGARYWLRLERLGGEEVVTADASADMTGALRWSLVEEGAAAPEDSRWRWSVWAATEAAESAPVSATFLYSQRNDAPGAVTPQAPASGVTLRATRVSFQWLAQVDPEGDSIGYDVEVYSDEGLMALVAEVGGHAEARWEAALEDNARYWWRVRASDAEGAQGPWGGPVMFAVDVRNDAPGAPAGVSPGQGEGVPAQAPVALRWEASVDPDGDEVSYEVEVYSASGVRVWEGRAEGALELVHPGLARGGYSWRVRASDGRAVSAWSSSLSFVAQGADPEPDPEPDMGPAEEPDMGGEVDAAPPVAAASGGGGGGCAQAPGSRGGAGWLWALGLLFAWGVRRF